MTLRFQKCQFIWWVDKKVTCWRFLRDSWCISFYNKHFLSIVHEFFHIFWENQQVRVDDVDPKNLHVRKSCCNLDYKSVAKKPSLIGISCYRESLNHVAGSTEIGWCRAGALVCATGCAISIRSFFETVSFFFFFVILPIRVSARTASTLIGQFISVWRRTCLARFFSHPDDCLSKWLRKWDSLSLSSSRWPLYFQLVKSFLFFP